MTKDTRKSGVSLVLAGAAGVVFFWVTDPRYGYLSRPGVAENALDQFNQAAPGTFVGIAGSALALLAGLWLMTRRTA